MKKPTPKPVNTICAGLLKGYDDKLMKWNGYLFDVPPGKCIRCGGAEFKKYDTQHNRKYGRIILDDGSFKTVNVDVVRYKCMRCGYVQHAEGAFYPNCEYGIFIVDLALYFSKDNPPEKVEKMLMDMRIQLDADTIRNYIRRFGERAKEIAPIEMLRTPVGVDILKLLFDQNNVEELRERYSDKLKDENIRGIESVTDETYIPKKGAKQKLREENAIRESKGEAPKKYGESFTTVLSYLPKLKSYAVLILTENPFNSVYSNSIKYILKGCDYNLTDGHLAYNVFLNHELCIVHEGRNERKRDKIFLKLKKEEACNPEKIYEYCHSKYIEKKREREENLSKKYPMFVEERNGKEVFTGATSTNVIEGCNHRLKYNLRGSASSSDYLLGRNLLILIDESLKHYSNGKPCMGFGAKYSNFTFSKVMRIAIRKDKLKPEIVYMPETGEKIKLLLPVK